MGVMIGIPSVGWQSTLFLKSLMTLVPPLNCVMHYKFTGTRRYGDPVRPVAEADNILMHEALQSNAKFLMSVEEDVIMPQMALRQLMQTAGLRPDATVVAGVVTSKTTPPEPMVYVGDGEGAYYDFDLGEVFEASTVHMGCTLIRLADLKDIAVPMVAINDYPEPGDVTEVREFFRTRDDPGRDSRNRMSQDVYFCRLIRQAGKKVVVDAGVNCGHFDLERSVIFGMSDRMRPRRDVKANIVNLGCGLDWDLIDGVKPLRVDLHEVNKPDYRADLRALPPHWTEHFDIVYARHVIEHFDRYELPRVFAEMVRICKPGGEIRIVVPSIEWAIRQLAEGKLNGHVIDVIWGGRSVPGVGPYPEMYHKMGITRQLIAGLCHKYGLIGRSRLEGYSDFHRLFKPPVRADVEEWAKSTDKDDWNRIFLGVPEAKTEIIEPIEAKANGKVKAKDQKEAVIATA